ncbi:MAG: hypothetical protein ACPH98_03730, partial [Candidatus Puniceispirillales bacterium]
MRHVDKIRPSPKGYIPYHQSRRCFALGMVASIIASTLMPTSAYAVLDTLKPIAMPSPKTPFLDRDGNDAKLADWHGTPLLVNF